MSDPKRDEKQEEKRGEKDRGWDEKRREDPLSAMVWAGILIWAGVALLIGNTGMLDDSALGAWELAFAGAGVIVLLEVLVRLLLPAYRQPVIGTFIFGIILLSIGLGDVASWELIWPVAVILLGLVLLLRAFGRR